MRKVKRDAPASKSNSGNTAANTNVAKYTKAVGSSNSSSPTKNSSAKGSNADKSQSKQVHQFSCQSRWVILEQAGNELDAIWLWQDDNDTWIKYDKGTSLALEIAYSQGSSIGRVDPERFVKHALFLINNFPQICWFWKHAPAAVW